MITVPNIFSLREQFVNGGINELSKNIRIGDVSFTVIDSSSGSFEQFVFGNEKLVVVYGVDRNEVNVSNLQRSELNDRILFMWKKVNLEFLPAAVKTLSKSRIAMAQMRESQENVIGLTFPVTFENFNNLQLEAKVDTGATVSSLHAEKISIAPDKSTVSFEVDGRRIQMPLHDMQQVKSADGGSTTRPVVKLKIKFDTKSGPTTKEVVFNLNDRSGMPHKVLLGKNFIDLGPYLISTTEDVVLDEDTIDWDRVNKVFENVETPEHTFDREAAQQVVETLINNDISLKDLITVIRDV